LEVVNKKNKSMRKKILAVLAIISFIFLIIEIAKSVNVLTAVR